MLNDTVKGRTMTSYPKTVKQWLAHLEALHSVDIELGLERVDAVIEQLNCRRPAPLVVLIAGTNGKGTTSAWLAALLRKQGLRVGCYNSPHIRRYNERVSVDGCEISDESLCHSFEQVEKARHGTPLTYFEFGTLAALAWFKEQPLDVCLLEIGLGGRLDAVNCAEADLCIVTSIGLDHQSWLGDTRDAIAREKYAIARPGKFLISGDPNPPASARETVDAAGGTWIGRGEHFDLSSTSNGRMSLSFRPEYEEALSMHWSLPLGAVPAPNVVTGLQTLALMGHLLPEKEADQILERLKVPGRLQRWQRLLDNGATLTLTLDVAHNEQAAAYLSQRLSRVDGTLLAMLDDKPVEEVVQALPETTCLMVAGLECHRGLSADTLQQRVAGTLSPESGTQKVSVVSDTGAGIQRILDTVTSDEHWLVVGSFFTVEAALTMIESEQDSAWKSI